MASEAECKQRTLSQWVLATLGGVLLCYLANVFLGSLNQDEGWYLYAARLVMSGELPHRDFFFTQGLVMPIVYAAFGWLWSALGVMGGRLFTAALSIAALMLAGKTVERCCTKREDALLVRLVFTALLGLNLWFSYFTTIPKAYGLCTFVMALGFHCLATVREGQGMPRLPAVIAGVCFAVLPDIRLSMGCLLPVIAGWLLWKRAWAGRWTWLFFATSAGATLTLLFLPELLFWPEGLVEACRFHAAREPMGVFGVVGCVARLLRFNPILVGCAVLTGWLWLTNRPALKPMAADHSPLPQLWLLCAGTLGAMHLLAPVPYDDYQVPTLLPLAMAVAVGFSRLPFDSMRMALAKVCVIGAVLIAVAGSPIAQDWMVWGQDRFWVQVKAEPDLFALRRAGSFLRREAQRLHCDELWTQDTYLAVEASLRVPKGLEMGPFSKPQPLTCEPLLAAWSGYTFALDFPSLKPDLKQAEQLAALQAVYHQPLLILPSFGQGGTALTIAERTLP